MHTLLLFSYSSTLTNYSHARVASSSCSCYLFITPASVFLRAGKGSFLEELKDRDMSEVTLTQSGKP